MRDTLDTAFAAILTLMAISAVCSLPPDVSEQTAVLHARRWTGVMRLTALSVVCSPTASALYLCDVRTIEVSAPVALACDKDRCWQRDT